jgi:hypothetical protein
MTYPFTPAAQPFAGQLPTDAPTWRTGNQRFWLGRPDGLMIQLPSPNPEGYSAPGSLGEVEHGLTGGASALTIFDDEIRRWTLTWPRLAGRDWQVVRGFYRRVFGDDPWAFVPPEDVNRLTIAQSMCGALRGSVEGWAATSGTVTYDAAVTAAIYPSGVLRWAGMAQNARLSAGTFVAGVLRADLNRSAPYLPAEYVSGSLYVATASGTPSACVRLVGYATDGTATGVVAAGPSVGLSATPQQLFVTAAPGALAAADYVCLEVQAISAASPNLLISAPQLSYTDSVLAWEMGGGVPRVNLVAPLGRAPDPHMNSAASMTLAETQLGVA